MRPSAGPGAVFWMAGLLSVASADSVDLAAAETQFRKSCGTCHVAAADAAPRQGPNLFGVLGRRAGQADAFKYSPAFVAGGNEVVWDEATLDRWLTDPQSVIPGSVMLYRQADPDKRRLIIEYLKTRR